VLVMQLNVPSAKNAERFVGALRRMGVERPRSASW
jgi:Flp pilus assembly CpaE family ATPase